MQGPTGHQRKHLRMTATHPRRRDVPPRSRLTQSELHRAVLEQRRKPEIEKQLPLIQLRQVCEKLGRDLVAPTHDARETGKQLSVRQRLQHIFALPHVSLTITQISELVKRQSSRFLARNQFRQGVHVDRSKTLNLGHTNRPIFAPPSPPHLPSPNFCQTNSTATGAPQQQRADEFVDSATSHLRHSYANKRTRSPRACAQPEPPSTYPVAQTLPQRRPQNELTSHPTSSVCSSTRRRQRQARPRPNGGRVRGLRNAAACHVLARTQVQPTRAVTAWTAR